MADYGHLNRLEDSDDDDIPLLKHHSSIKKIVIGLLLISFVIAAGASASITSNGEVYVPEFFPSLHWQPPQQALPNDETDHNAEVEPEKEELQPVSFMRDPEEYVLQRQWNFSEAPRIREYNWTITDAYVNPDGVYREMLLINGQYPGPTIEAVTGDTIRVHIHNAANNATSFHWHGLFHRGSNYMDGTVGITQCPIQPNTSFTYEFKTDGQWGTYWYHSHLGTQYTDGLFGPLILHSQDEPAAQLEYETDQVVMLHDHYHVMSADLLPEYLASDNENAEPVPDGALINGRNIINCDQHPTRKCDNSTNSLATINLNPSKSHRIRFINVGGFAEFEMQLDNHLLPVVELDGSSVHAKEYHKLLINTAQRYSVILSPPPVTDTAFWLRARMVSHCFAKNKANLTTEVQAIVRYSSDVQVTQPTTTPWDDHISLKCTDINMTDIRMVDSTPVPLGTQRIFLRSNFEIGAWRLSRGFFNTSSWHPKPQSPLLNRVPSPLSLPPGPHPAAFNTTDLSAGLVVSIQPGVVVDLLVDNFDDGNHPFHLHGHKFWIMAHGHGYFNESSYETLPRDERVVKRDTVTVEAFGWVMVRFVADNAGLWAFHCHNVWHAEAGLMMAFAVGGQEVVVPQEMRDLCLSS